MDEFAESLGYILNTLAAFKNVLLSDTDAELSEDNIIAAAAEDNFLTTSHKDDPDTVTP